MDELREDFQQDNDAALSRGGRWGGETAGESSLVENTLRINNLWFILGRGDCFTIPRHISAPAAKK